ncbi:MAG: ATP-binding protein [Ignavibacteriae bacterium]|nr:ATP-binding protein [Ignavibacteriota bacterium]
MKNSPFIYGNVVADISFTNRDEESKKLYSNLTNGINTTIISPRRWGKSSLVEKVFKDILKKNKNTKTIIVDLFLTSSEEEFLELFAKEIIKASSTKIEDLIKNSKDFFKQLIPQISFGADPNSELSLSFNWTELKKNKNEILDLAEQIAIKKKNKFVIGLDEFQNLATFTDYKNLEKNMRAIWQRQKHVTYCIFGSKRHMMTEIFDNSTSPFYRFGDIILLQKISTENWVKFISDSFKNSKKLIKIQIAHKIPTIMKNHSWYVQQLSHYTWNLTDKVATNVEIKKALEELISANTPLYQKDIEQLSKTQINLLKAITQCEQQLTSANVMQKYKLGTPRNVTKNREILINNDFIHYQDGKYEFLDPAFELWFNKVFYNKFIEAYFSN